jgi:hypothetical protein
MDKVSFNTRLAETGLQPKVEDIPKLEALVADMDRAAALVRGPRSYAEEPLCALRLPLP